MEHTQNALAIDFHIFSNWYMECTSITEISRFRFFSFINSDQMENIFQKNFCASYFMSFIILNTIIFQNKLKIKILFY